VGEVEWTPSPQKAATRRPSARATSLQTSLEKSSVSKPVDLESAKAASPGSPEASTQAPSVTSAQSQTSSPEPRSDEPTTPTRGGQDAFAKAKHLGTIICGGTLAEVKEALPLSSSTALLQEEAKVRAVGGRSLVLLAALERKVSHGDTTAVCRYLAHDLGLEVNCEEGQSRRAPMFFAAKAGSADAVRLLLDMKAHPDAVDPNGQTPLFYAAAAASGGAVSAFVAAGADVERRDNFGQTALFYAASAGKCAECIKLLPRPEEPKAENGAEDLKRVAPRDASGRTPLFVAAQSGRGAVCRALLECLGGADDLDDFGLSPLFFAAAHGSTSCIEALVEASASIDRKDKAGQTALFYAAARRNLAACQLLVESGANPWVVDANGMTALDVVMAKRPKTSSEKFSRAADIISFFEELPGRPISVSSPAAERVDEEVETLRSKPPRPAERSACIAGRTRGAKRRQPAAAAQDAVDDEEAPPPISSSSKRVPRASSARSSAPVTRSQARAPKREVAAAAPVQRRSRRGVPVHHQSVALVALPTASRSDPMVDDIAAPELPSMCEWLETYGLVEYAASLKAEGFEDLQFLKAMSHDELDEMLKAAGVTKMGHRVKFRCALRALSRT